MSGANEVCDRLGPVLVPAGFAAGQTGGQQVIFCAALDEIADRFPGLPQATMQARYTGACVDLVVDVAGDRLMRADIEELSLAETLRQVGLGDGAEAVDVIIGSPVHDALAVIVPEVVRLWEAAQRS